MTLIILHLENDLAEIGNENIDIYAEEAAIEDECKCTAKAFAVFEGGIGTGVHHEFFGESGLSELFTLTSIGKAFGQVIAKGAFARFFHREVPLFR